MAFFLSLIVGTLDKDTSESFASVHKRATNNGRRQLGVKASQNVFSWLNPVVS